ncbi:rhomboid family intramembrane serine protease [Geomesophilobacter sediminis]|uniref:Peptidase S54 rhomboid domain-containing protein n=1 Tax=Geomesophilobacter sediminis TaxID=2798584 RepID=A0A8J7IRN4_9BACT|nr:rhomboid family intramembrane serine protease [Geomesophilobacter sediminis]MBJ6725644.1 hypothetical protein [Geomesophilobacter sediminis]
MRILDALEKKLGRFAIPNLTVILIAGQSLFYVAFMTGRIERQSTELTARYVMEGEWWRIVAFPFDPPRQSIIFAFFAWYIFYLMGTALEQHWGSFRYNVYLILGCAITVATSFITPDLPVSNAFLAGSVFLAFATIFPDYEFLLFFVLPVKVKWLALLAWGGYAIKFIFGDWGTRLTVLAATANFLLFFARDISFSLKQGKRRVVQTAAAAPRRRVSEPIHRCAVCGITDKTNPDMDFRYCPKCEGQQCYCQEHIFTHQHKTK